MTTPAAWQGEAERLRRDYIEPVDQAVLDRFWSKVDTSGECWVWTGARTTAGYGEFYVDGGMVYAHRWSSELADGPIPAGLFVLHHCDNRACVRPDHLFRGTAQDNTDDMWRKGRARPRRFPRGIDHPVAKLSDAQVAEIRQRRSHGESRLTIAADFGITPSYVYDLMAGRARTTHA